MAGPIKIAILADASAATAGVKQLSADVESSVGRTAGVLEDAGRRSHAAGKDMADGIERGVEGADKAEQRAMGFRDTLTGVQDTMSGTAMIAKGDLLGGFLTLGMGIGDLASGFANLLIPLLGKAAGAMKALNLTFLTNPVFLVIAAIVALVAVFVIAYKRSETFRRIVNGAFSGVVAGARALVGWIRAGFSFVMGFIGNPFRSGARLATSAVSGIVSFVRRVPGWIMRVFVGANTWLASAGRAIVSGLWSGISSLAGWLVSKVRSFIASTVPGPIARALGIASPSRVTRQLGRFVSEGLAVGMGERVDAVRRAAGGLSAAAVPSLGSSSSSSSTVAGAGAGIVITFDRTGDPFLDLVLRELRKRVRVAGGNVQTVLAG